MSDDIAGGNWVGPALPLPLPTVANADHETYRRVDVRASELPAVPGGILEEDVVHQREYDRLGTVVDCSVCGEPYSLERGEHVSTLTTESAHWVGRIGGILFAVIAAFATGVLFADSSSDATALARYAAIWPILAIVTVLAMAAAVLGLWE